MDKVLAAMENAKRNTKAPAFTATKAPIKTGDDFKPFYPSQVQNFDTKPDFIDKKAVSEIKNLLDSNENFEIEASLGVFIPGINNKTQFIPGVSVTQFQSCLNVLKSIKEFKRTVQNDTVDIDGTLNIRKITMSSGKVLWQKKNRDRRLNIENRVWGYRISSSTEEILTKTPPKFTPEIQRQRTRQIFTVNDTSSEFYGVRFDLTQIIEENLGKSGRSSVKYEVEIERSGKVNVKTFEKAIELITRACQNSLSLKNMMTMEEREYAINIHNTLFAFDKKSERDDQRSPSPFTLIKDYWNKPVNIKTDDLLNPLSMKSLSVTVKLDGVRRFILVDTKGVYACSPPDDIWKIGDGAGDMAGTLLDSEQYTSKDGSVTFHVFDILFFNGKDVRQERLDSRLKMVTAAVSKIKLSNASLVAKKFHTDKSFYKMTRLAFEEADGLVDQGIAVDGLIFQPAIYYKNPYTRKWKPASMMTIDFKLGSTGKKNEYVLLVKDRQADIPFGGSKNNPLPVTAKTIIVPGGISEGIDVDGLVVECKYNFETSSFEILRNREDRGGFPNALRTAADVWDDIMHPLSRETMEGSTLQTMRRLHNLFKDKLLSDNFSKGSVIMDWGSGRGGDLSKWAKHGISKVFVVEPDPENLAILEDRQSKMYGSKPEIVVSKLDGELLGGQNTEGLLEILNGEEISGLVSFFSLTFFGRDKSYYQGMIDSIDQILRGDKQKFVGIVMDGDRVANSLEKGDGNVEFPAFQMTSLSKFERDVVKKGRNEISIKITDPDSMVDQKEWLFYFNLFEQELSKRGFSVTSQGFIDEDCELPLSLSGKTYSTKSLFENLPDGGKAFSSLNRYFVFERKTGFVPKKSKTPPKHVKTPEKASPKISPKASPKMPLGVDKLVPAKYLGENIYRMGVIQDSSSFAHAILRAFDEKYLSSSEKDRKARVEILRKVLGKKMKRKMYDSLCSGCVAKAELKGVLYELYGKVQKNLTEEDLEEAKDIAYAEFKLNMRNPDEILEGQKTAEIFSTFLKVNIIILDRKGKVLQTTDGKTSYKKTIVVSCDIDEYNALAFSLVSRKSDDGNFYTIFRSSDSFVKNTK